MGTLIIHIIYLIINNYRITAKLTGLLFKINYQFIAIATNRKYKYMLRLAESLEAIFEFSHHIEHSKCIPVRGYRYIRTFGSVYTGIFEISIFPK